MWVNKIIEYVPGQHIPAVQPNSQFTPNSVNIMSQHELLVMLMEDMCHSGYVACMIGQIQVQNVSYSCLLRCLKQQLAGDSRDFPKLAVSDTKTNTAIKLWLHLFLKLCHYSIVNTTTTSPSPTQVIIIIIKHICFKHGCNLMLIFKTLMLCSTFHIIDCNIITPNSKRKKEHKKNERMCEP